MNIGIVIVTSRSLIEKSIALFVVLPIFFYCHLWYSISRVNTTCANTVGGGNQMELDFSVSNEWQGLSDQEKQQRLFDKQKGVLDTFLVRHLITQEQYDLSLHTLMDNMAIHAMT